jgi:hypothetical protein
MSVTYTCPECGTVLRPKAPLPAGKKVKCPKCGAIFAPEAAAAPAAVAAKPGRPAAKPAPAKKKDDEWGDTNPYGITEDTGPKAEAVTFDQIRDRFPKSARGPAQKEVVRPANTMLAISIKNCLICIGAFLYGIWPFVFISDDGGKDPNSLANIARSGLGEEKQGGLKPQERLLHFWIIGSAIFLFCWNGVIVVAAYKMHTLESYAWAMTGAIMGLIAGLGLIVSIWCLIVLNRESVKAGFAEQNPYK